MSESIDVRTFHATLTDVLLPMGLNLDEVRLEGEKLHGEKKPFRITLEQPGKLEVVVSEASLTIFLNKKAPGGLQDLEIQVRNGRLFIDGRVRMIIEVAASAVCTLRIVDGKQLFVDLESVDVLGVGAKTLVQNQLDSINPVLDASDLPLDATLTEVHAEDGRVVLRGLVSPPPGTSPS